MNAYTRTCGWAWAGGRGRCPRRYHAAVQEGTKIDMNDVGDRSMIVITSITPPNILLYMVALSKIRPLNVVDILWRAWTDLILYLSSSTLTSFCMPAPVGDVGTVGQSVGVIAWQSITDVSGRANALSNIIYRFCCSKPESSSSGIYGILLHRW